MKNNANGIFDRAAAVEIREDFLSSRQKQNNSKPEEYDEMASYIRSSAVENDLNRLKRGEFFFSAPRHFRIPKNLSQRKRDIYVWYGTEKYLLSLLCYLLRDYDSIFSPCLYSFRSQMNAHDFIRKLLRCPDTRKYYIVKADISSYASSIVPEQILPQLKKIFQNDPGMYSLYEFLLLRRECIERDGSLVKCEPGILGGNPLSNFLMNVCLMDLDTYYECHSPLYCRYSDDLIIFAENRAEAERYISFFQSVLKEKHLTVNPEKMRLIEPGEQVDILGYSLNQGILDIADHSRQKLLRKIRMHSKRLILAKKERHLTDREAAVQMTVYCNNLFFGKAGSNELSWSRWIFPVINTIASLKEMDHYAQEAIRYVYCGSFSAKRYRLRYRDLQKMGYRSLVHEYYHFER